MNIALIFAGGVGTRMNSKDKPKQFLELHDKPIIIYTLEHFQNHPEIDGIIVVMVAGWLEHFKSLIQRYQLTKVFDVVIGGETGQLSIYNGLTAIEKHFGKESIVLIHDGVRPLINQKIITDNINQVKRSGSAITTSPTIETFVVVDDEMVVQNVPSRKHSRLAKAPQSFILSDIISVHRQAMLEGIYDSIDCCTLMSQYGHALTLVEGPVANIKVTTPTDYYIFRAIVELDENRPVFNN